MICEAVLLNLDEENLTRQGVLCFRQNVRYNRRGCVMRAAGQCHLLKVQRWQSDTC